VKEEPLSAAAALALLRENADRLAALAAAPAERLHAAPQPGEWSPNDVLAHVRACCDMWGGNIARILADDHPTFPGRNPRWWMRQTDYPAWPFERALHAFSTQRAELLANLQSLAPADWERTATVTAYGQRNVRTLRSYASQLARHERPHVDQIARALSP
jgi:hypothetical protein